MRHSKGESEGSLARVRGMARRGVAINLRVYRLVKSSLFLWITFTFHFILFCAAWLFFRVENGSNPNVHGFFDAIYWAFSTAATVGYGDVSPVTTAGRVLAMLTMITGPTFSAIYTALFASAILAPEFEGFGRGMRSMETHVSNLEDEVRVDERQIALLMEMLRRSQAGSSPSMAKDKANSNNA